MLFYVISLSALKNLHLKWNLSDYDALRNLKMDAVGLVKTFFSKSCYRKQTFSKISMKIDVWEINY